MVEVLPDVRTADDAPVTERTDVIAPHAVSLRHRFVPELRGSIVVQREVEFPFRQPVAFQILPEFRSQFACVVRIEPGESLRVIVVGDLVHDAEHHELRVLEEAPAGVTVRPHEKSADIFFHIRLNFGVEQHQQLEVEPLARAVRNFGEGRFQRRIRQLAGHIDPLFLQRCREAVEEFQRPVVEFERAFGTVFEERRGILPAGRHMMNAHDIDAERGHLPGDGFRRFRRVHVEDAVVDHVESEPAYRRAVLEDEIPADGAQHTVLSGRLVVQERDVDHGIGRRFADDERKLVLIHGPGEGSCKGGCRKYGCQKFLHLHIPYLAERIQRSKIGQPGCCVQFPSWSWRRFSVSTWPSQSSAFSV